VAKLPKEEAGENRASDSCIKIRVLFVCPVCKEAKELGIPPLPFKEGDVPIKTVSIPRGLVCEHHFQAFVDSTYKVRSYQKVDAEIADLGAGNGKDKGEERKDTGASWIASRLKSK
jgi:hypothetical protein